MGALWVASENALFVYFQGRYLPALYFVARAVAYPLLNFEQSRRAARAFADWFRFVEVLRKRNPEVHRALVQKTASSLGAVLLESLQHRLVFAVGRATRAYRAPDKPGKKRKRARDKTAILTFFVSLGLQHLIGWPTDYLRASAKASAALATELGVAAVADRDLLRRVSGLALDIATLLQVLQPHQVRS